MEETDYFPEQKNKSLEWVRVPGERYWYDRILKDLSDKVLKGFPVVHGQPFDQYRMGIMSEHLRLSEKSAPVLHDAMRSALRLLERPDLSYDLFQIQGNENACTKPFEDHPLIILQGKLLSMLDRDCLQSLLGHELGHCFCHSRPDNNFGATGVRLILEGFPEIFKDNASKASIAEIRYAASAYLQCSELTADRVGVLATQSAEVFLRETMIEMTGLQHDSIHWDIESFLAQCQVCVDNLKQNGVSLSTHPDTCFRSWAAWKFEQTDMFKLKTGKGPGNIKLDDLNKEIADIYAVHADAEDCDENLDADEMPEELRIYGLCTCFLMAIIDGDFTDEEADFIENFFGSSIPDFKTYFNVSKVCQTINELTPYVARMSESHKFELFTLLYITLIADGVVDQKEFILLLALGQMLGCAKMWCVLFEAMSKDAKGIQLPPEHIRARIFDEIVNSDAHKETVNILLESKIFSDSSNTTENDENVDNDEDEFDACSEKTCILSSQTSTGELKDLIKRPQVRHSPKEEAQNAIHLYCENVQRRGKSRTTLARLFRLAGMRSSNRKAGIELFLAAFEKYQIEVSPEITESTLLQDIIELTSHVEIEAHPSCEISEDSPAGTLIKAFSRLQAAQVNGNGHSQSVRCKQEKPGRAFDMTRLNKVTHGRTERVLTSIEAEKDAVMISPTEAGRSKQGIEMSHALENLFREMKSRMDEQGASHLYLGSSFISGCIHGYEICAPLMLRSVELKRIDGGVYGWSLVPIKDTAPKVNHAVLRMIAAKGSASFTEDMIETLDEAALHGDDALTECVQKYGFFMGVRGGHKIEIQKDNSTSANNTESSNSLEAAENSEEIEENIDESDKNEAPDASEVIVEEDTSVTDALYSIEKRTPVSEWRTDDWLCLESCSMLGFFPQSTSETLKDYNEILKELQSESRSLNDILGSLQNVLPASLKADITPSNGCESQNLETQPVVLPLVSLDPSQMEALLAARSGESLVIDGPPGTGKSQVIVGIVLDALSRGLKVAVISEKRAALDVVAQRLTANGFDDIYGIVHDVNKDKNELFARIAQRMKTADDAEESTLNQAEYDELCKQYQAQIENLNKKQQILAIRYKDASFSDYARYLANLTSRLENTPVFAPLLDLLHQRETKLPFVSKMSSLAEPRIVDLISNIPASNLEALNEALIRFIPFERFYRKDSWWSRHLDIAFLTELPGFAKFVDETTLHCDAVKEPVYVDDNTCLECWYQLFELVKSGLTPEYLAKNWSPLVDQIEALKPQFQTLISALKVSADMLDSTLERFSAILDEVDVNVESLVLQLSQDENTNVLTLDSPMSREKLLDIWARFTQYLQNAPQIQLENLALPWTQLTEITAELIVARGSVFRFFKPSWYRQEKAFRLWFEQNLPSHRPEKITIELLKQVSAEAQLYIGARKLLCPCMGAERLGIQTIQEMVLNYQQVKNQMVRTTLNLNASLMPQIIDESSLEQLLSQAKQFVTLQTLIAPISRLENYGQPRVSNFVHENLNELSVHLFHLFEEYLPRFPFISQIVQSYSNIPELFEFSDENIKSQIWQIFTQCVWCESRLKSLAQYHPEILSLCSDNPQESCEERISRFKRMEVTVTEKAQSQLRAKLLKQGILSVPKPLPRARRTPEQKEVEAIRDEASKKTRHLALRTFIHAHTEKGLLDIIPVWLLSPETMTVLFPRKPIFDLIVFDEASQATVASSLPALLRAKRWIIAGDDKQMPPSSFFSMSSKKDSDESKPEIRDIFDSESLLTLARSRAMHTRLSYHYRSRHDELIAFSNYAFYEGALKTVPALPAQASNTVLPPDSPERIIRWVAVEHGTYDKGRNPPEAKQVAMLLYESLKLRPEESVGVITFNINQRNEVLDAVDALCRQNAEFSALWDHVQQLPIDVRPFVKSIENVQGDERDAIFFSLGHCAVCRKNTSEARVPARFGPIGQKGGERRLNVAISRAKIRTTIVASFEPNQLFVGNVKNVGPTFFKLFVDFAWAVSHDDLVTRNVKLSEASRILPNEAQSSSDEISGETTPLNKVSLTAQIAAEAERVGFEFEQNVGLGPFKIPLAIYKNNHQPTAVLVQETATCNAYDSVIHQPNMLIQKGWHVIQISSLDWLLHRKQIMSSL